jgi:hypothetical protein
MTQMSKVNCQYGAPMGRWHSPDDVKPAGKVRLFRVRLDSGGYDDGGAYWGAPNDLYCAQDDSRDYQRFTRAQSRESAAKALDLESKQLAAPLRRNPPADKPPTKRINCRIKAPCSITPRLLPGIRINDSWLSIEYAGESPDGRQIYRVHLDTPAFSYSDETLRSGIGGGTLQQGLESCLSFMGACAESIHYSGQEGENSNLFPPHVGEWCAANSDELGMLQCLLEETKDLIEE